MEPFPACSYCGGVRFFDGPRGGAAMNCICCQCGASYNLLVHPGAPIMLINELSPPRTVIVIKDEETD